jgi:catalase
VSAPKPVPASFATEPYFGVNAFELTSAEGKSRFALYQIRAQAGEEFLSADEADAP